MAVPSLFYFLSVIQTGGTLRNGDQINATINGVKYEGIFGDAAENFAYLNASGISPKSAMSDSNEHYGIYCADGIISFIVAKLTDEPPTTDYNVSIEVKSDAQRVIIPQDYVEGLPDLTTGVETAKTTAETAKTTAETAKTMAESAKIKPNSYNYESCLISKRNEILGWFSTYVALEYDTTRGCFYKSVWETDPITEDQMPSRIFGSDVYFAIDGRPQEHILLIIAKVNRRDTWYVYGLAFSLDSGKIYVVETAGIPYENATGLFFEFTPVEFSPIIPSSTSGSTKKFKITVDDSGTISASEVT